MTTTTLYIIDPSNFKGQIVNTMSSTDKVPQFVDYMDKPTTFEEYKQKKGNQNLIALTWEDFSKNYYIPYLNSLCEPFTETTEERFMDALECVPPKRWTKFEGGQFFFVGECYTADLYTCFVKKGNKYYTALRSITESAENLIQLKD
jgi:hypothetical protein